MQKNSTDKQAIKNIVIVGGGTAGWMTAAALSKVLGSQINITLIESEHIGTIGVGEATIPQIGIFNGVLGINEDDFVKYTKATFKLGIEFVNWSQMGSSYIHPFSKFGTDIDNLPFHHYWQKLFLLGKVPDIGAYSLNVQACHANRFTRPPSIANSPLSKIAYAFHFDAGLYANYLREYAETGGVKRIEGIVENVRQNSDTGFIEAVQLKSSEVIEGDLFFDCTGFRGLLIEQTLKVGYQNWSHYLPCNSAITVPSVKLDHCPPYTRATALPAGWQWRIPLQHRTGNGHVYSNDFMPDNEAESLLFDNIEGETIGDSRLIRFTTGRRNQFWHKNCVAIGLSSGFLEPLESTSIHLIQNAVAKFLGLFPTKVFNQTVIDKYNQQMAQEFSGIRDFLILHYKATERTDSQFWNYCRTMAVPDSVLEKIDLYQSGSRVYRENNELFDETSWIAVLHGQGIKAHGYNPIIDSVPTDVLLKRVNGIQNVIDKCLEIMPKHSDFIHNLYKNNKSQP